MLDAAAKKREEKKKSSGKNLIKKCLTHPFPESDNLHSAAPFVCRLIICRAREDPSVFPRQPRSAAGGSGRRTMSHFAARLRAARAAGEAGRRLLGPASFPTTCGEPGFRLPAAVLSLCSSDCDVVGKKKKKQKNSKLGARDSPGFDSLVNVRHWKGPLTGATFSSAETACHSSPGRLRRAGSLILCGRRGGAGGGAGSRERRPGSFPPPGNVRREIAPAPTAH